MTAIHRQTATDAITPGQGDAAGSRLIWSCQSGSARSSPSAL